MLAYPERGDALVFTAELLERWLGDCAGGWPGEKLAKPWLPSIAKLLNAYGQALSVRAP